MMKHSKMKTLPPILVLLAIFLSVGFYFWNQKDPVYQGRVETVLYPLVSEVSGIIQEFPVSLGEPVLEGDILARIEDTDLQVQVELLTLSLEKARLQLQESSLAGGSQASSALQSAQASYSSAAAAAEKAESDYRDMEKLYEEGAISFEDLERSKLILDQARSGLSIALSGVQSSLNESGRELLAIQLSQAEIQLKQAKDKVEKTLFRSPVDGFLVNKNYQAGSLVAPGYQLGEVGDGKNLLVVFFVSEKHLNLFSYETEVILSSDSSEVTGEVVYVDKNSQFTPREYQTKANRNKTSFLVKASLPEKTDFQPGDIIQVSLSD
jgi:HlyD family secretion protein